MCRTEKYNFAVIFDMDGVIVNSNPVHKIALKQFCNQQGYFLSEEDLKNKIYGRANKDWLPELFNNKFSRDEFEKLANEKEALYRKMYASTITPVKGLLSFLERLAENNITRAIATSAPPDNVEFTLKKTKTHKYFNIIIHEKMISKGKPDPEVYLKTISKINFAPEKCIVIEDSLAGVEAAKKAGTKVIGLTTTLAKEELYKTDRVINDFDELKVDDLQILINSLSK